MNAIQLADKLDTRRFKLFGQLHENPTVALMFYYDCANMLREQERAINCYVDMLRDKDVKIEELKQIVESTIKQAFYEDDYHQLKAKYDLLKEQLEDCTCQGGHSEAYLKVKGKL